MSNSLVIQSPQITSLDIAEMTGVRHDNVKTVVNSLAANGVISHGQIAVIKVKRSRRYENVEVYIFTGHQGELDSYVVIARVAPQYIGEIVAAWGRTKDTLHKIIAALEQFDVPEELSGMQLYAIVEKETGNVKIGISSDPERRLKELQIANSSELVLVATMPAVNRFKSEKQAHLSNEKHHIRGEWFNDQALHYFN